MISKFIKTAVITVAATACLSITAMAANTGAATVDAKALNLRSEPGYGSEVLTIAPQGAAVAVSEKISLEWYKVCYKGYEGYMNAEFLKYSDKLDASFGTGVINGDSVRMRAGAGFEHAALGYFDGGVKLDVIGIDGEWYKVSSGDKTGYVHSDYMSLNLNNPTEKEIDKDPVEEMTAASILIETSKKYLDVPYVYGGTSTDGFDCSGFVYYVYAELGYTINRTAETIYQNGTYVAKDRLQAGDVVCFTDSSGNGIGHCGIYIGNSEFIHASSGGGKVMISSLYEDYYSRTYYGSRRILE